MVRPTYTGPPLPIGYVELQSSWVGIKEPYEIEAIIDQLRNKGLAENPGLVQYNARVETVKDGAGVDHFHLYMGFAPAVPAAEPLNPYNLNDAPPPQPGWPEPTDGIVPLGSREQKF